VSEEYSADDREPALRNALARESPSQRRPGGRRERSLDARRGGVGGSEEDAEEVRVRGA
jgi:hypothetical protein